MEDLEEHIPVFNVQINDNRSEVRIVKKSTNDGLFFTTEYEKVKLQINSVNTVSSRENKNISDVVSLAIVDILSATPDNNCFKIYGFFFRKVLCYGRLVLKNIFTTSSGKNCHLFTLDDGTQEITAKYYMIQERKKSTASNKQWLTNEKKKLSGMRKTGINISGKYLDPATNECQKILETVSKFQHMIEKNIAKQAIDFQLGPIAEKALICARPYKTATNETCLYVYDISLNDKIELYWKNSLNKLYRNQYLKRNRKLV